ncbi:hypothetical protein Syun_029320 [Stephania yunnanensis]|uniref:RNase H type-1 domain-containing protein n=1 Tax=Stephania yunnanensis TaxID=152371 RepID=A0AAP0HJQ8_9MAGN
MKSIRFAWMSLRLYLEGTNFSAPGSAQIKPTLARLEHNWVKVNVDSSSNIRNGEARAVCVVHNTDVKWLARSTKVLGRCSPITEELCALLGRLQLRARLGFERIVVETDFKEV